MSSEGEAATSSVVVATAPQSKRKIIEVSSSGLEAPGKQEGGEQQGVVAQNKKRQAPGLRPPLADKRRGKKWRQGDRFKSRCLELRAYINRACQRGGGVCLSKEDSATTELSNSSFSDATWKRIHGDIVDRSYHERFAIPGLPSPDGRMDSGNENEMRSGEDMYMQLHVNGLCVIGLAPFHPVLQACAGGRDSVAKINYVHTIIQGKGKKKASKVQPGTVIAEVELVSGERHRIRSPVAGKLFGHNSAVVQEPSIITSDPRLRGYIGMVMLNGWEADILKANLANATEYNAIAKAYYAVTQTGVTGKTVVASQ